tara:strand:- start:19841 stop:21025 length:1185 start_codon:yes stop_codon:yes gene_type:complete
LQDQLTKINDCVQINIPSIIISGGGAFNQIGTQAIRSGIKKGLVVTDPYMVENGIAQSIKRQCDSQGLKTYLYDKVTPEPTDINIKEGLQILRENRCDGIIAVGGGSCLDAGKGISIMATNKGPISRYAGYNQIPYAGLPLLAVPTTAGTGSEMTRVTVITDTEREVKMMLLDPHLLPKVAIVDYTLTLSMPKPLTAHVGVDTLTHGIEAYVSRKASNITDALALTCVALVGKHLVKAWQKPNDHEARKGMMEAASLGGMAFSNSSVGLVHGMSRPLGALFHIPHGLSNSILLPTITSFSIDAAPKRYSLLARTLGWAKEGDDATKCCQLLIDGLEALNNLVQIPSLKDLGISKKELLESLNKMTEQALESGSPQNNPRIPSTEEIKSLYMEAY